MNLEPVPKPGCQFQGPQQFMASVRSPPKFWDGFSLNRRQFLHHARDLATAAGAMGLLPSFSNQLAAVADTRTKHDSWTLFRGNTFATGEAVSCLPGAEMTTLWKYKVENGAFESTPVIVGGICYLPDLDGFWHALQLHDGALSWKRKTKAFGFAASPAYYDDRLYVGDIDGIFYCFDLQGEEKWRFEAQAEISSSANFYKGQVLFGSQDATLYCLDRQTGKLDWKIEVDDQIRCAPTVVEDRSFVAGCDGRLHIIDLVKEKEVASVEIGAPTGATPAVMGDHVYFATEAGDVFDVDWKKAEVVWCFTDKKRREIRSSVAVNKKMLVVGSRSKYVYGINPESGKNVWTFTCKRSVDSSPLIACGHVFVAASDGRLYLLDVMTGKEVWKKETGDRFTGSPAVVDGKLVIASDDGVVYCFGRKAG